MKELNFYIEDKYLYLSIAKALEKYVDYKSENLVFVFIGTDSNIGDSLAPLSATLINLNVGNIFTYGNLTHPITAKEVPFIAQYIKKAHPDSTVVVVDAAVGKKWDVGRVKVQKTGLKPGLGVDKDLPMVGDLSIIGVVGEKADFKRGFLTDIRLSSIYKMATNVAKGIEVFIKERYSNKKQKDTLSNEDIKSMLESANNRLIG